jgi:hypothetical protein
VIPIHNYQEIAWNWRFAFFMLLIASALAFLSMSDQLAKAEQEPQTLIVECRHSEPMYVMEVAPAAPLAREIEPEIEEGKYASLELTDEERMLAALTLYHEARGEGRRGMKAVLEVIFNRAISDRWPQTVKEVIYAPGQFAVSSYLLTANINDPAALATAYDIVNEMMETTEYMLPDDYVYFATSKANGTDFIQIGNHYFSK